MQQKKEERRQTEETTTAYLTSIAGRYQYRQQQILTRLVDIELGYCLERGLVHGFTNIDEARRRRRAENKNSLTKLFWEAAV
jgi:hypothetical protein